MKKFILIFILFVGLGFGLTSCNKERTCQCTTKTGAVSVEVTKTVKGKCSSLDTENTVAGVTTSVTCKKK